MRDKKKQATLYIIAFAAYTTLLFFFLNQITAFVASKDGIESFLMSLLGQPANIFVLISFFGISYKTRDFLPALAGFMITMAFTFVSVPHCMPSSGDFTKIQFENTICPDVITIGHLTSMMPFKLAYLLYYWLAPIVFVIAALKILGHAKFMRSFEGGGGAP